jgi:ABC-2 type transport system permease protein
MTNLRVAFVGGFLAYRGLYDWYSPRLFVAAMLATPAFQVIFFATYGPAHSGRPAEFFAAGNAVQACAMAGIFGVSQTIANERLFGTMGHLVLAPASRAALYIGRSFPHVVTGMLISAAGLLLAWLITDFALAPSRLWALATVLLAASADCAALGVALGALGLVSRDTHVATSVAYLGLLLVSGAAVPPDRLPAALRIAGEWLPLGNAIAALRHLVAVGADGAFAVHVLREILVAAIAVAAGAAMLRRIELRARRRGDIDLF